MSKTPADSVSDWREVSREPAGDYRIFSVERSVALSPVDGMARTFHRIRSQTWTQIIPITSDEQVVMIRQYRHGAQRVTLEIPGGLVDEGEDLAGLVGDRTALGLLGDLSGRIDGLATHDRLAHARTHANASDVVHISSGKQRFVRA